MKSALVAAFAVLLLAVPPVAAAAPPTLKPQDREQIGVLIDRFIKEAVRRENLRDAWSLTGPSLRGGTTRAAWADGSGVTVVEYPALGSDFRNAWTSAVAGPGKVDLQLVLHPTAGHPKVLETAFNAQVIKERGRWVVNTFYPAATYNAGHVVGPHDFQPLAGGGGTLPDARISPIWGVVGLSTVGALIVLLPISFWLRAKRRDRRAYESYLATRR